MAPVDNLLPVVRQLDVQLVFVHQSTGGHLVFENSQTIMINDLNDHVLVGPCMKIDGASVQAPEALQGKGVFPSLDQIVIGKLMGTM